MDWLARLKNANTPNTDATKATKPGFVGFVASHPADSQKNAPDTRGRMLALADAEGVDVELVHQLPAADLHQCDDMADATAAAYLHAMQDTADRETGRLPPSYTARALCRHCGPVWLPPAHVAGADTVGGWPYVLGCPWCHVTPPEGMAIPRPPITSATCAHWTPDSVNPPGGMGHCACGWYWPNQRHACANYVAVARAEAL